MLVVLISQNSRSVCNKKHLCVLLLICCKDTEKDRNREIFGLLLFAINKESRNSINELRLFVSLLPFGLAQLVDVLCEA